MSKNYDDSYPGKLTDEQIKKQAIQESIADKKYNFPTEAVELPSKGLCYPKDNPLSTGVIDMKYMTAKEEDILTSANLIRKGTVLDELFKSLILSPINYNDLIVGDKNAIMIASRILGYGSEYRFTATCPACLHKNEMVVNLSELGENSYDVDALAGLGENGYIEFELPASKRKVKVKILTQRDQTRIDKEVKGLAKLKKTATSTVTMKHVIVDLDGETDNAKIRKFVDTELLAMDSRAIRQFLKSITPDIEMKIEVPDGETGDTFRVPLSIGLDFFWPDVEL